MTTIRRLAILVLGSVGVIAVAADSASAGLTMANHCHPERTYAGE